MEKTPIAASILALTGLAACNNNASEASSSRSNTSPIHYDFSPSADARAFCDELLAQHTDQRNEVSIRFSGETESTSHVDGDTKISFGDGRDSLKCVWKTRTVLTPHTALLNMIDTMRAQIQSLGSSHLHEILLRRARRGSYPLEYIDRFTQDPIIGVSEDFRSSAPDGIVDFVQEDYGEHGDRLLYMSTYDVSSPQERRQTRDRVRGYQSFFSERIAQMRRNFHSRGRRTP